MQNSCQASRPSGWSGIDARRNKFVFLQFLRCHRGEGESRLAARWRVAILCLMDICHVVNTCCYGYDWK